MSAIRTTLGIVAIFLAGIASVVASADPSPIVLRFNLTVPEDSPRGRAAERFKELAEARTHGGVHVELFPNGTLYGARDELEALQLGAVQMACAGFNSFSALGLSDFDAFELPYLFDSYDTLRRVTDGPVGASMLAKLREKGIEGLGFWDLGFKQMTANRPLRLPEDVRGLSIRTRYSRVSEMELRALEAIPKPMGFVETREALGAGALDGTEFTAHLIDLYRLDEVQSYLTISNHAYIGSALVVNRRFWERLPRDIRAALAGAAREATIFANEAAEKEENEALSALRARGHIQIIVLTASERRRWKQALMPVHRESEDRISAETLAAIYSAAGFSPE